MDAWDLLSINILSPVVLAFVLGVMATLIRSDLKVPADLYAALTIYLLLALGLKGGAELSDVVISSVWKPFTATVALGVFTTLLSIAVLRHIMKLAMVDACAIAAHYGSVSVVTFMATITFLETLGVASEAFMTTLVVILEVPAILVALIVAGLFARQSDAQDDGQSRLAKVLKETLSGRSIVLLVGGLVIGVLSGKAGISRVAPLFIDPFQGAVMLFLLEMGMVTARRLRDLARVGPLLLTFALLMPILNGALGVWFASMAGLSLGGTTILGVMGASASYIAAPAAVRLALPDANPSYYLTMALAVTFPFNLTLGIPLYFQFAKVIHG